ncbi:MAG: hypothetical protein PHF08_12285 [Candidatus Riflebacteria bacterium]|nr:hypothetical protein [Candidatus Riflebacteria bacterium]MDD3378215.1 hypothetical protein [Candidatus Riflebacteria bacterium]
MAKELCETRINNIRRGSYWFGIIGRLLFFMGILNFGLAVLLLIPLSHEGFKGTYQLPLQLLLITVQNLFTGWLFLMARDAFDAIIDLFIESRDIV